MERSRDSASADITSADITSADTASADTDSAVELTIDCECCSLHATAACEDCVVTFLLGRDPEDAVVIDAEEARAMRMLGRVGLVPSLRYCAGTG